MMKYVLIGAAIVIAAQGLVIWKYDSDLTALKKEHDTLKVNYGVCTSELSDQNAAIKAAGEEKAKLEDQLNKAAGVNDDITKKNRKLQEELAKKPIPQNCPDQISEIKAFAYDLVKEWNK